MKILTNIKVKGYDGNIAGLHIDLFTDMYLAGFYFNGLAKLKYSKVYRLKLSVNQIPNKG